MCFMRSDSANGGPEPTDRQPVRVGPGGVTRLRIAFHSDCANSDICNTLENLSFPLTEDEACCQLYALMELVANAVRASRSRDAPTPVRVEIWCDGSRLMSRVSDSAGGFDPALLPYDFYGSDDEIDLESEAFDAYRQRNRGARFGLGLIMARRAADEFRLFFVDGDGRETPWRADGSVRGTVVAFSKKMTENEDGRGTRTQTA